MSQYTIATGRLYAISIRLTIPFCSIYKLEKVPWKAC